MAGRLLPLDGLPGRFASVSYDSGRQMIMVRVDDAEGNVMSSMSWGYSEPVVTDEPAPVEPEPPFVPVESPGLYLSSPNE